MEDNKVRVVVDNYVHQETEESKVMHDQPISVHQDKMRNIQSGVGMSVAAHLGKKGMNYVVSNYGNLTGDYLTQARIQETMALGFNLVLLVKGGFIGATVVASQYGTQILDRSVNIRKSEIASEMMRNRLGISKGGSRL